MDVSLKPQNDVSRMELIMSFPFITGCSCVHRLDSHLSETSIKTCLYSSNQPRLDFSLRILQSSGTIQNGPEYTLVCSVVVAVTFLQCVNGTAAMSRTSLLTYKSIACLTSN